MASVRPIGHCPKALRAGVGVALGRRAELLAGRCSPVPMYFQILAMLRARAVPRVVVHAALHAFSAPIGWFFGPMWCTAAGEAAPKDQWWGRSRTAGLVIGPAVVSAGRRVAARLAARPIYTDEFCRPLQSKVAWTACGV